MLPDFIAAVFRNMNVELLVRAGVEVNDQEQVAGNSAHLEKPVSSLMKRKNGDFTVDSFWFGNFGYINTCVSRRKDSISIMLSSIPKDSDYPRTLRDFCYIKQRKGNKMCRR